jgi:hypothetical protein
MCGAHLLDPLIAQAYAAAGVALNRHVERALSRPATATLVQRAQVVVAPRRLTSAGNHGHQISAADPPSDVRRDLGARGFVHAGVVPPPLEVRASNTCSTRACLGTMSVPLEFAGIRRRLYPVRVRTTMVGSVSEGPGTDLSDRVGRLGSCSNEGEPPPVSASDETWNRDGRGEARD